MSIERPTLRPALDQPETRYAAIGADRVAYQVIGEGPRTLLLTSGFWSHIDMMWEDPALTRFMRRLASFCRVIAFDRRGCALSDKRPDDGRSIVEHWIEDVVAVMDTLELPEATILSMIDSGPLVLEFVARHPGRCSALIFANTTACSQAAPDYPIGRSPQATEAIQALFAENWGREEFAALSDPSLAGNAATLRWYAKFQRAMASPRVVVENLRLLGTIDARHALAGIHVPTLVIARTGQTLFPPPHGRYIAEHVAGARFVEIGGADLQVIWEGADEILGLIEEFMTGLRRGGSGERALATLLFTDIVDSTRLAAKLGDAAWRALLDRHDQVIRDEIGRHGGRLVDSAGDGSFASFAAPGDAIDCALALHAALEPLKIEIRSGLHIGEIELREEGRIGGMAVHIGARVLGRAEGGEVLVSRTVRDVLIGSRYEFKERGIHTLKGVPSKWPLYAVEKPKSA